MNDQVGILSLKARLVTLEDVLEEPETNTAEYLSSILVMIEQMCIPSSAFIAFL
jgi:hypothetical protein